MPQKKYINHIALRDKLKRLSKSEKVIGKSYSALATLVFDTSLKNNGFLRKEVYYGSSFEQPDMTYKDWIEQLKKAGIFEHFKDENLNFEKADWIRFKPGPVTLSYINKEKIASKEIVTKDEVLSKNDAATKLELEAVKEKLAKTDERLSKVEISMDTIYKKLDLGEPDPPFYKKLHQKIIPSDDRN